MENIQVTVLSQGNKRVYQVERFSTLEDVAALAAPEGKKQYVAAFVNKKLKEMAAVLDKNVEIEFIPLNSVIGIDMYKRSLTLLMIKAFSDVLERRSDYSIRVMYSLGPGYFCRLISETIPLTPALLQQVKDRMQEIVDADEKLYKETLNTDEAGARFAKRGMPEKERLFRYRRVSKVNLYRLGEYEDYYYGYMLPSTGYLTAFDLVAYDDGFVLVMPKKGETTITDSYQAPDKLYQVLRKSDEWGDMLGIASVGEMNDVITQGDMNDMILVQEALQEKQIAEIAQQIMVNNKKIVLIAGPSSSGKTTFSHRLSIQLRAHGMHPHPLALDNYFVEREHTPKDANGNYDFECLGAMDLERFGQDMQQLLAGETVEIPRFDFHAGKRVYKGDFLTLGQGDVLVAEGIHALNPKMTEALPDESKFKIYISALTQINIDEHNRVPTTDGRLLRRIVRDARTRGNDAQATIRMWESVRRGEEQNIFPFQEEADVMFNSALIYELAAIKQYAEPLLFAVPKASPEYYEAKRLLKFLDYFLGIDISRVPQNSILREFIGGGCFDI
jgi:uridine kinase